jgi:endonuclease/exonuclease/phosphatase family metal-dependent hydrolase
MTYNLQSGMNAEYQPDNPAQCQVIATEKPDILGCEEVAVYRRMKPDLNMVTAMAETLKMNSGFAKAIDLPAEGPNSEYGVAAFSKYPMEFVDKAFLPSAAEARVFGVFRIHGEKDFYFVVTHFLYNGECEGDEEKRVESVKTIEKYLADHNYYPAILVGDLNASPDSPSIQYLHEVADVWNDADKETKTCYSSKQGWVQIDYIASFPKGAVSLDKFYFGENNTASDHRPVIADLIL